LHSNTQQGIRFSGARSDPSGFSFWTSIRDFAITIGAGYICGPWCTAAVGAYRGAKTGGFKGALIGGLGGYYGYQAAMTGSVAATVGYAAAAGCISADAAGGSCT
jgi:hypothetical protein